MGEVVIEAMSVAERKPPPRAQDQAQTGELLARRPAVSPHPQRRRVLRLLQGFADRLIQNGMVEA